MATADGIFRRVDAYEYAWCLRLNRGCQRRRVVRDVFSAVSKLGDGIFWYGLILLLPAFFGAEAILPAVRMAIVGIVGVLLYKYLKSRLVRERPYISLAGIVPGTPALDRYSFPSGHTLHAVSFTWQACTAFPELAPVFVPLALAIAASRVVLGLHYPTDVLVGAALGAMFAGIGIALV
jgi:undecaprenyl-diphosphatase